MALYSFNARAFAPLALRQLFAGGFARDITDTDILQKPVDYALMGEQRIKRRYRINEVHPPNVRTAAGPVTRSGVKALGGKSGFTVKSGPLGGSHR